MTQLTIRMAVSSVKSVHDWKVTAATGRIRVEMTQNGAELTIRMAVSSVSFMERTLASLQVSINWKNEH